MRAAMVCTLIACAGCASTSSNPSDADPNAPGLRAGDAVSDVTLTDTQGQPVTLASFYDDQPVVVLFYRGGWCPFCQQTLSSWIDYVDDVQEAGAAFVAITPESPDAYAATIRQNDLNYTVLGDPDLSAAKAFNVYFALDEEQRAKLENFGIDVAASNSSGTWELPAPGTFIIDTDGVVRFAHADWDYTRRADPEEVVEALAEIQ